MGEYGSIKVDKDVFERFRRFCYRKHQRRWRVIGPEAAKALEAHMRRELDDEEKGPANPPSRAEPRADTPHPTR